MLYQKWWKKKEIS